MYEGPCKQDHNWGIGTMGKCFRCVRKFHRRTLNSHTEWVPRVFFTCKGPTWSNGDGETQKVIRPLDVK